MKQNKLAAYSAFAAAVLSMQNETRGEAVYHDIDPDVVLAEDFDFVYLDIDANGMDDFLFLNFSYYYTDSSLVLYQFLERIWMIPEYSFNGAVGSMFDGYYANRYYPFALEASQLINEGLSFQFGSFQRMAFRTFSFWPSGMILQADGGNWYPEQTDKYLGITFQDEAEGIHYGWIRCDVQDSGRVLTIKDYAYEVHLNTGIKAGDVIGDTTSIDVNNPAEPEFQIWTYQNILHIKSDTEKIDYDLLVYNSVGELVYRDSNLLGNSSVPVNVAPGNYWVRIVTSSGIEFVRQFVIL